MAVLVQRLCPMCGTRSTEELCPQDGNHTVVMRRFNPNAVVNPGDIIGDRYLVLEVIGKGGYGSILAAEHLITGQEVAIKVLKTDFEGPSDAMVRRFFREARVTAALTHPHTVRVFDVGQTPGGAFFIAMERLHGPSLEKVLQDRAAEGRVLTEAEAIDIVIPVLRSLHEAHTFRLVHRDLKPANIVLADFADGERIVKLLDFGIASTHGSSLTTTGMALGTPAYMSPEQCEAIELDGRSDLYSVGIILYRCVSGDVPFNDRNAITLMQNQVLAPLPDLRLRTHTKLSEEFIAVVEKALSKAREDRFDHALQMRHALQQVRDLHHSGLPDQILAALGLREAAIADESQLAFADTTVHPASDLNSIPMHAAATLTPTAMAMLDLPNAPPPQTAALPAQKKRRPRSGMISAVHTTGEVKRKRAPQPTIMLGSGELSRLGSSGDTAEISVSGDDTLKD